MATFGGPLDELVDFNTIECLNQDEAYPVANAFTDGDEFLASHSTPELLVKVGFIHPVKLCGIKIQGTEEEAAPQRVKVFLERPQLELDQVETEEPAQELVLDPEHALGGTPVLLRTVKFQHVQSIQLFVGQSGGSEQTRVERIRFYGQPALKAELKEFKPPSADPNDGADAGFAHVCAALGGVCASSTAEVTSKFADPWKFVRMHALGGPAGFGGGAAQPSGMPQRCICAPGNRSPDKPAA
eukprot:CAMPEP_0170395534 /NCGR_PEP_ID=MMETSP0117_2-20130122/21830_1 /TAXON_ID=400756 /ORGANISM="Durinskia baltica, Strain CSIRO CS-38" /LENGTH=241 /DNA_ID=CAMNT_0010651851 /DNA_START=44 /DNA_END=768 /DNA_ORIENTATION=-